MNQEENEDKDLFLTMDVDSLHAQVQASKSEVESSEQYKELHASIFTEEPAVDLFAPSEEEKQKEKMEDKPVQKKRFSWHETRMSMKENGYINDRDVLDYWLYSENVKNYTINDDLTVDVDGSVNLSNRNIGLHDGYIPIRFGKVSGDFNVSNNNLTCLKGCPSEVGGNFNCSDNNLKSIEDAPLKIGGKIDIDSNYNDLENEYVRGIINNIFHDYSDELKTYLQNSRLEKKLQEQLPQVQQEIKPKRMKL